VTFSITMSSDMGNYMDVFGTMVASHVHEIFEQLLNVVTD